MKSLDTLKTLMAAGALAVVAGAASASTTVQCPDAGTDNLVRYFELSGVTGASCFASGTDANIQGKFGESYPQYVRLAETGQTGFGDVISNIDTVDAEDTLQRGFTGTFDFSAPAGYFDFIILFKAGFLPGGPTTNQEVSWAAFSVPGSFNEGLWSIKMADGTLGTQGELSGVSVWAQIPLPAAGWLLLGGLGALGFAARRKRKMVA